MTTYRVVGGVSILVVAGATIFNALWYERPPTVLPATDDEASAVVWAQERWFVLGDAANGRFWVGDHGRRFYGWDFTTVTNGSNVVVSYARVATTNLVGCNPSSNVIVSADTLRICAARDPHSGGGIDAQHEGLERGTYCIMPVFIDVPTNGIDYSGAANFPYLHNSGLWTSWWTNNNIGPTGGVYWFETTFRVPVYSNRVVRGTNAVGWETTARFDTNNLTSNLVSASWVKTQTSPERWSIANAYFLPNSHFFYDQVNKQYWYRWTQTWQYVRYPQTSLPAFLVATQTYGLVTQQVIVGYALTNSPSGSQAPLDRIIINTNVLNDIGRISVLLTNTMQEIYWWQKEWNSMGETTCRVLNVTQVVSADTQQNAYETARGNLSTSDWSGRWWVDWTSVPQLAADPGTTPHPPGTWWYYSVLGNSGCWTVNIQAISFPLPLADWPIYTNISSVASYYTRISARDYPYSGTTLHPQFHFYGDRFSINQLTAIESPRANVFGHWYSGVDYMLSPPVPPDWQGVESNQYANTWRCGFAWSQENWWWSDLLSWTTGLYEVRSWAFSGPTNASVFIRGTP